MSKREKKILIYGDQLPILDAGEMARVILRFARAQMPIHEPQPPEEPRNETDEVLR